MEKNHRLPNIFWSLIKEGLAIAILGALFSLVANAISPFGLNPTRPMPTLKDQSQAEKILALQTLSVSTTTNTLEEIIQLVTNRLAQKHLGWVRLTEISNLLSDPKIQQASNVIVIDTRTEKQFSAACIPGAILFNPYRYEAYVDKILGPCLTAEKIILYCEGGACDDSELAATLLADMGIPKEKIAIFLEGFDGWKSAGLPTEVPRQ